MFVPLILALPTPARAEQSVAGIDSPRPDPARIQAAVRLMADLRDVSRRHAAKIRSAYAAEVRVLSLKNRTALRAAHDEGHLTVLADLPHAHNLRLRLAGQHPIGELDLANQDLYLAARPETIGCLLHVASRVRSGALEVTSLARHNAYQRALARRNANARTLVPTHAMGLAFDISILHAPLETAREIRDVLEQMAADGDLLFIAEQRQLVFHVVPARQRRDYYAAVAHVMTTAPPAMIDEPQPAVTGFRTVAARELPPTPRLNLQLLPPARYAGLFGGLFVSGLGVPPGEDLLLAGAGALVGQGVFAWWPVILLALISVVASDAIWFSIGRTTARLSRRPRIIPAGAVACMDRFISRWGRLAIALARFIPGSRALVFGSAGARGIRPRTFLLIDAVAALAWVALIVSLGTWVISVFTQGEILLPSGRSI